MLLQTLLLLATTAVATQETIQVLDGTPLQRALDEIEQTEFGKAIDIYPELTNNIDREKFFREILAPSPSLFEADDLPRLTAILRHYIQSNPHTHVDDEIRSSWKKELTVNDPTLFFAKRYVATTARTTVPAAAKASPDMPEQTIAYEAPMAPSAAAASSASSSSAAAAASPAKEFTFLGKLGGKQTVPMKAARNPVLSQYLAKYPGDSIRLDAPRDVITMIVRALKFGQTAYDQFQTESIEKRNEKIVDYIYGRFPLTLETYYTQAINQASKLQAPLLVEVFTKELGKRRALDAARAVSVPLPPVPSAIAASAASSSSSAAAAASAPPLPIADSGYYLVSKEGAKIAIKLDKYTKWVAPKLAEQFAKNPMLPIDAPAEAVTIFAKALKTARQTANEAARIPKITGNEIAVRIKDAVITQLERIEHRAAAFNYTFDLIRMSASMQSIPLLHAFAGRYARVMNPFLANWDSIKKKIESPIALGALAIDSFLLKGFDAEHLLGIPLLKINIHALMKNNWLPKDILTRYPDIENNPMTTGTAGVPFVTLIKEDKTEPPARKIRILRGLLRLATSAPWDDSPVRATIAELSGEKPAAASASSSSSSSAAAKK